MLERVGSTTRKGAVGLLLAAAFGLLLTMTSEPARISAHDPPGSVFWLHCTETTVVEHSIHAHVTLKAPTDYRSHFYAYWHTDEWQATEADYKARHGDEIHSTDKEADLSEYMVFYEGKHDLLLEGPEKFKAYYTPTQMTDMSHPDHDNECDITLTDDEWLFTDVKVLSEPDDGVYYVGQAIEVAAIHPFELAGVENNPTMRIWIGSDHRDVVYDRLGPGRVINHPSRGRMVNDQELIFRYVVKPTDVDTDGIEISGGLKTDFTEFFIPAWPQGDIKYYDLADHQVDGTQLHPRTHNPKVSIASTPSGNDQTYDKGESIDFALTFPVAIDVRGYPALAIEVGDKNDGGYKTAIYKSGSGTETLVFTYQVQVGDRDDDGVTVLGTYYEDEFERGVLLGSASLTVMGTDIDVTPAFEALKNQSGHKVHAPGGL